MLRPPPIPPPIYVRGLRLFFLCDGVGVGVVVVVVVFDLLLVVRTSI